MHADPHPHDKRAGAQVVEAYGDGRFRVSGSVTEGSVIVLPTATHAWPAADLAEATAEQFAPLAASSSDVELLLLGCGARVRAVPDFLRNFARDHGLAIEPMDTGAAARTYNLLAAEGRRVAAALIAVD